MRDGARRPARARAGRARGEATGDAAMREAAFRAGGRELPRLERRSRLLIERHRGP
jgi:hypothetical protein